MIEFIIHSFIIFFFIMIPLFVFPFIIHMITTRGGAKRSKAAADQGLEEEVETVVASDALVLHASSSSSSTSTEQQQHLIEIGGLRTEVRFLYFCTFYCVFCFKLARHREEILHLKDQLVEARVESDRLRLEIDEKDLLLRNARRESQAVSERIGAVRKLLTDVVPGLSSTLTGLLGRFEKIVAGPDVPKVIISHDRYKNFYYLGVILRPRKQWTNLSLLLLKSKRKRLVSVVWFLLQDRL